MLFLIILNTLNDFDRDIVEGVYHNHKKQIIHIAKKFLKNNQDVEDALSETMLKVIRYKEDFIGISDNEAKKLIILYTKSTCIDMLRKKERRDVVTMSDYTENDNGETTEKRRIWT